MKFELEKEPEEPTIIEGFPGFGFVGTICTEFLIDHLDADKIGKIISDDISPTAAIHNGKVIDPLEVYYDDENNIVILRALGDVTGNEWKLAAIIENLGEKLKAKEIISLEGVAGQGEKAKQKKTKNGENQDEKEEDRVFYFSEDEDKKAKLEDGGLKDLKNGIIKGVTGALILKMGKIKTPLTSLFVKAHPQLPDSRAAGEIIKSLDEYLGLEVDYEPLMETAEKMEKKLKQLAKQAKQGKDRKKLEEEGQTSYLG